jgi:hypothetical protein
MDKHTAFRIAFLFCATALAATCETFQVTITDQLQGTSGFLAFDLIAGSPTPGNMVTISDFSTDGTLTATDNSGAETGSLVPGPAELADSDFFNELLQGFTYGTTISFDFAFTDNTASGGIPDNLSFYLLDSSRNPFPTSDSVADSLISVDLDGAGSEPQVFTSTVATAQVTPLTTAVPEPSYWSLTAALLAVAAAGRRRWLRRSL